MHAIFYQGHLEVLPGPVRFYQGPGPYGPWCSYATVQEPTKILRGAANSHLLVTGQFNPTVSKKSL